MGGGDSAVESALLLAGQNKVTLSYRRETFQRIKPKNNDRIRDAMALEQLEVKFNTNVEAIEKDRVLLKNGQPDGNISIPNDLVIIFAGGELPTDFLQKIGLHITKKFGEAVLKHK